MVRRVFGWHTGIPGCAYYRIQLPLGTLATHTQGGAHLGGKWHTEWGQKLPLPTALSDALNRGYGTAPADIATHMAERFDVVIGQQIGAGGTGADHLWQAMARHRDRHGGPMLVLETDDDLTALHSGHLEEARREMATRADVYRRAIAVADVVTVTTPALAETVQRHANGRVVVIPNYIDRAMFDVPGGGQHIPPTRVEEPGGWSRIREGYPGPERMLIGWGGSSTHRVDFDVAWPGLQRLLNRRRDVCFAAMGVAHRVDDPAMAKLERRGQLAGLRWMDMAKERWPDYWRRIGWYDVGIAPLETNPFNDAKSWIKILEYCAMGVPFVASASPEYRRFLATWNDVQADALVSYAPPGLLVEREHDWWPALEAMTSDWAELRRMQARARIYARQFTIQDHISEWAAALAAH